jgi:ribosomal protein L40E
MSSNAAAPSASPPSLLPPAAPAAPAEVRKEVRLAEDLLPVPSCFYCQTSQEIMQDPVATLDGHVYGCESIAEWFPVVGIASPLTGSALPTINNTQKPARHSRIHCPAGHVLRPFTMPGQGGRCDHCGTQMFFNATSHGCRQCDYDLCPDCVARHYCPAGHFLQPFVMPGPEGTCDRCGTQISLSATAQSCRLCNFDLCPDCAQGARHGS